MVLVYSLGAAILLSAFFGFIFLYTSVKKALMLNYVPKIEEKKEEKLKAEDIERILTKFFPEETLERKSVATDYSSVSPKELKLKGILISDSLRGAVFENGKDRFVGEGESIKGYTLKKVKPEGVILSYRGKDFFLEFKVKKGSKEVVANIQRRARQSVSNEIILSRRDIEAITRDPAKMFTQIRLVPYVKGGKTEGFIFEWVKPGSIFHRLGIRRGDILVSINNMTITSGEDAFRILQMLRNEPNLKVVLIRRGKKEEINVRIE